ncbi:M20 family metallopeptidase [Actinoplanes friuliensis]|uniref:Peptidase dimerization domain-containing protein n=1 Tax=Actinoplanes friuliensis DSM 7358 TaxID=1246995 RepID=U5VYW7_9ACTN|nr:M20 family metallopeptidase [Actinoplanes friuliensis]AGZ42044.1 peptidase dimerization domain-containing protein [Actinoplanes friuliensis DSM 7358]
MDLVHRMSRRLPQLLADIEELVVCESPSSDFAALARSTDVVADLGKRHLGAAPERIATTDGRTHLRWRLGAGPARVLLLGHHDTVWPLGSLTTHPYAVTAGVLRGPGCVDMKAGLVLALHALAELGVPEGVTLLITCDEELGSPTSRELVETSAAGCAAALVLEAAAAGGALKTERKGVSRYRVRTHGRAAHAGLEPERGVNATVELAHQILALTALADVSRGTTVTPTLASSGTSENTVPAVAEVAVDVRVRDTAEQDRVDAAMHGLRPVLPGSRVEVLGGPNRPPLDASSSAALFARATAVAARLGLPAPGSAAVGGGSDGNFTAGIGTPTLDGLGAVGGGAHADDEHVLVDELPARAALIAGLIADVLAGEPS